MWFNPNIFKRINQIVYRRYEPVSTNVLWAKLGPEANSFTFYVYENGSWHDLAMYENVVIPDISVNLSDFNNDAGFLTEHQSLDGYVNAGSYDSQSKKINLKHNDTTVISIDATDFIKDGMVNGVTINNGIMVITFNTDAGKEPIEIPLDGIFNPSNYYDKDSVDQLLQNKADAASISQVATSGDYNDLINKPEIPEIPNRVSVFYNDIGYLTEHQSLEGYALKSELFSGSYNDLTDKPTLFSGSYNDLTDKPTIPSLSGYATESWVEQQGYLTEHQSLDDYALKSELFSGSYEDLTDKPDIPIVPTDVSAFNNDAGYLTEHQDISVKADKSDIQYEDVYLGVGASAEDIIDNAHHHEVLLKGKTVEFQNASGYIWAVLPENYEPVIKINGFEVPNTLDVTVIENEVTYKVWKSNSQYNGTFSIYLF